MNKDRMKSSAEDHAEAGLWRSWIANIKREQPDEGYHENVFGILIRQSKQQPKSPLQLCLEDVKTELPMYHAVVMFMDGATFLWMSRRRVVIHVYHERAGGERAHRRMILMMKACDLCINGTSFLTP